MRADAAITVDVNIRVVGGQKFEDAVSEIEAALRVAFRYSRKPRTSAKLAALRKAAAKGDSNARVELVQLCRRGMLAPQWEQ